MMRIIDTHSHLYGNEFADDLNNVVERARQQQVEKIFLPNINESTVEAMLSLCSRWPGFFYPMLGLHPTDVKDDYPAVLDRMQRRLVGPHPFIAIGEVGLDYYWDRSFYKEQQEALIRQVEWAVSCGLPLMLHTRSAHREMMNLLSPYKEKGITGVFHSFGGSVDEAEELLSFDGFMLGINGVLTFKKSELSETLRHIPLDRVVVETDAPYLSPVPFRGKRNESSYIYYTLLKLADVYKESIETVAEVTRANALRVFTKVR